MKTKTTLNEGFKPITVTLTLETMGELRAFYNIGNRGNLDARKAYDAYSCSVIKQASFAQVKQVASDIYKSVEQFMDLLENDQGK